jgi:hypothetical protein
MPETTISNLPDGQTPGVSATTPLDGTERVPMDQGETTVDATTQDIADLADSAIAAAITAHEAEADPHIVYALKTDLGDAAALDVGTTAGTVAAGDDGRLSDSRTPTTHKTTHAAVQPDDLATVATTGAYADLSGSPTLGTAAAEDVGTASGNVVQLDGSGRLPAVDGSLLTNLPAAVGALDDLSDVDLTTTPPGDGEALVYDDDSGNWVPGAAGASAAGAVGDLQFNNGTGGLGASADLNWDDTGKVLEVGGDINLDDGGANQTTLQLVTPTAARTITFPDATGTVGLVAGSTGQLVFNNAGAYSGGPLYDNTKGTLGYTAGGTITQGSNKSTGVTLEGASGRITLNAAALAADTTVSFTLTNTSITANDLLLLNHVSGGTAGAYTLNGQAGAGTASINVRNVTGGSLSEAIVIGFAVLKA